MTSGATPAILRPIMAGRRPPGSPDNRTVRLDGAKVEAARKKRGLSRAKLAEQSKGGPHILSDTTIKRAEAGEAVYANTAGSIAELLGVPVDDLLLEGAGSPGNGVRRKTTLAVMPFRTEGGTDSLADGLAEDLITRLSRWWFPLISRTSTFVPSAASPVAIANEVGAKYWIDGSIRRSNDKLRVTVELVDADSKQVLTRRAYERAFGEVFAVQRDLTTAIVGELSPSLLDAEVARFDQVDPDDLDAWQQALLGAWHFYRRTAEDNLRARDLLQHAVKRDQRMPIAWFALALTHQQDIVNQWTQDPKEALGGLGSVCTAFERLYPTEAWSHVASAYLDVYMGRRDAAVQRLREAIDIDPNTCLAYSLYGQALAMAREPDQGLEQFELALRLSPKDTERWSVHTGIALAHFVAERYEETVVAAKEASLIRPSMAFPYGVIASAEALRNNVAEAKRALETLFRVAPNTTLSGIVSIMGSTEKDIAARYLEGLRRAGFSD